jgi:hypothetical protein
VDPFALKEFVHVHRGASLSVQAIVGNNPGPARHEEIVKHPLVPFVNRQAIEYLGGPIRAAALLRPQADPRSPARIQQQIPDPLRRGNLPDESPLPGRQHRTQRNLWVHPAIGHLGQPSIPVKHFDGVASHLSHAAVSRHCTDHY